MDLWDSILKAPILLKIVLFIMFAASFYTAAKVLWPITGWLRMIVPAIRNWLYERTQDFYWLKYKPNIKLVKEPSTITKSRNENGAESWSSTFKFRVQNRDSAVSSLRLDYAKMRLRQGSRWRMAETVLSSERLQVQKKVLLQPFGSNDDTCDIDVIFENTLTHDDIRNAIEPSKSYKWEINGITIRLKSLKPRDLRSFKGEYKPTCEAD